MANVNNSSNHLLSVPQILTSEALALNDKSIPPTEFDYTVYEAHDSGYQSIEHAPDMYDGARAEPTLAHSNNPLHTAIRTHNVEYNVTESNPRTYCLDMQSELIGLGAGLFSQGKSEHDSQFNDAFDPEMVRYWDC